MATKRKVARKQKAPGKASTLMLRLDDGSKADIVRAAELRRVSVSDYVRTLAVGQARRELAQAAVAVVGLTPEEQLAFWNALNTPPRLSKAQRRLGALMRGEE